MSIAIRVQNLSKCYQLYNQPHDRLKQFLWRGRRQYYREFWALKDVSFEVAKGEVLGIVGLNGSGKSTLLQLICGTLTPTHGEVTVQGRIAALLELGAGFNPEFSGRENVFMSAAIMGLSQQEIEARFEEIVDFSGIRDFIDQPVKTYSSGMYVRLAFSVAISVDPDILVIDEALSVGDGTFAHKSFDRIMQLRKQGATIVFCSHNLFQVDMLCDKALWLEHGRMRGFGAVSDVLPSYTHSLEPNHTDSLADEMPPTEISNVVARIKIIEINNTIGQNELRFESSKEDLRIRISFQISPKYPPPSIAIGVRSSDGRLVCSAVSRLDEVDLCFDAHGDGEAEIIYPAMSLLKGEYLLDVYLMCELGIHVYDQMRPCATLLVSQQGLDQGLVNLPHRWEVTKRKT